MTESFRNTIRQLDNHTSLMTVMLVDNTSTQNQAYCAC